MTKYSQSFNQCMKWVFRSEGGYVNNKHDPGGCTNLGVTIHTLKRWRKKKTTCRHIKNLTKKEAMKIYKRYYWDVIGGDRLPAGANYVIFDMAVNAGTKRAIKLAQRAAKVVQDGKIGPVTIGAINRMGGIRFIKSFSRVRLAYYKRLKGWKHFGRGWRNRVNHSTKRGIWLYKKYGMVKNIIKEVIKNTPIATVIPPVLMDKVDKMFNVPSQNKTKASMTYYEEREYYDEDIRPEEEPELEVIYGDKKDNSAVERMKGWFGFGRKY
jgi:lysozyme family protein